jgi:hypothetical protein
MELTPGSEAGEQSDQKARGLRRFLLRGLEKVDAEWHLITATHNPLKLFRFRRSQQQALVAATR